MVVVLSHAFYSLAIKNTLDVKSSAKIGLSGEAEIEKILSRYKIINTAKSGKCADFIILVEGIKILIESKKYSTSIPRAEIDKFYRDLDANASVDAGMIISLTSKITGYHNTINRESKDKPVILLSLDKFNGKLQENIIHSMVELISAEVRGRMKYISEGKICNAVEQIESKLDLISRCRLMVHETQDKINRQFTALTKNILEAEISIKNSVSSIKNEITECKAERSEIDYSKIPDKLRNVLKTLITSIKKKIKINENHTFATDENHLTIKINKTKLKCIIQTRIEDVYPYFVKYPSMVSGHSYNNGIFQICADENNLQFIIEILNSL
jgi:hypothetical protein